MKSTRSFITKIDRLLDTVCARNVDALVFRTGHVPHIYTNGKSVPVSSIYLSLTDEDVWAVARSIVPEKHMQELGVAGRTSIAFDYGAVARFEIMAEKTSGGLRMNIWKRGRPRPLTAEDVGPGAQ